MIDRTGLGPLLGDLYRPGSPVTSAGQDLAMNYQSEFQRRQMALVAMLAGQRSALARSQPTGIVLRREVMRPRRRWWQWLLWWRS